MILIQTNQYGKRTTKRTIYMIFRWIFREQFDDYIFLSRDFGALNYTMNFCQLVYLLLNT